MHRRSPYDGFLTWRTVNRDSDSFDLEDDRLGFLIAVWRPRCCAGPHALCHKQRGHAARAEPDHLLDDQRLLRLLHVSETYQLR